ncbi:PhzF family phenazine biosynthesis protein [uncultured Pelagimonas sp.]|uniref:PhzF family phenazine biosynthesis protein n=1 Tax=uncultured Pelagimonas sp. TaxID=1618102 RepID=UPI00261C36D0|nr:PhzF family phenazine biosynthesis protein [uncultured Pelagimonas sp.]
MAAFLPKTLAFATCDVFTTERFAGNPLAIVLGADDVSDQAMQTIAREFNLSETIFVQTPDDPAHTAKVRIFFPTAEIPFAGHPTIGCAIHLATKAQPSGDFDTDITLEEQAGLVPVRVWRKNGVTRAEFQAPVVPFKAEQGTTPETEVLARALGISATDIGFGENSPGIFEGGPRFMYVPVKDLTALAQARPMEPAWSQAIEIGAVDNAYLYTPSQTGFQARMFSPTAGIPEDPATGSASAILAAQLLAAGHLKEGETQLTLTQGLEMGRPSQIGFRARVKNGALDAVYISGSAVPVSTGHIQAG